MAKRTNIMKNCYMHCFTHLICAPLHLLFPARLFGVVVMAFNWNLLLQVHWLERARGGEGKACENEMTIYGALFTPSPTSSHIASMKRWNQVPSVENIDDAMFPYESPTHCMYPVCQSEMIRTKKEMNEKRNENKKVEIKQKMEQSLHAHTHTNTDTCTRR